MAEEKKEKPNRLAVAVLLTGRISQLRADAETHPDAEAKERLMACARQFEEIVFGRLSDDDRKMVSRISVLLTEQESREIAVQAA